MQLPAEQTSLEPLPHRVGPDGRRPFKSQSARSDGSRFTSDTIWAQRSRVPDSQAPKVDLNKLPILYSSHRVSLSWAVALRLSIIVLDRQEGRKSIAVIRTEPTFHGTGFSPRSGEPGVRSFRGRR